MTLRIDLNRAARRPLLSLLAMGISGVLHAEVMPTMNDWGTVGLMQTPTARMAPEGEFSLTANHVTPYSRYSVSMQPYPWLEGAFRYTNVQGARYGRPELSGDQNFKDKSIDVKLRLWQESRWIPEVAFGARDIGGTGLFSSEYVVASKRFGPVDASLGLATGYLGSNGDFENPLGAIDDRFDTRPTPVAVVENAGRFGLSSMFRGPVGVFGGISYQTPWEPLLIKIEYDGHDYDQEFRLPSGRVPQDSRVNLGVHYTLSPGLRMALGWERGNEFMATLTFRGNLVRAQRLPRMLDPAAERLRERSPASVGSARTDAVPGTRKDGDAPAGDVDANWQDVARRLGENAGIVVEDISVADNEVIVRGEQRRYFYPAEGLGRAARVLHNSTPEGIDWFTLEHTRLGMPVAQSSVSRDAAVDYIDRRIDLPTLARQVELNPPGSSQHGETVLEVPPERFTGGFAPGFRQIIGGPDGFILYQLTAGWSGTFHFSRNTWLSGTITADVHNNFDKFKYDAPSRMPRVRTNIRQFVTTSDVTIPSLQLTTTRQLGRDVYGMAYAGLLEFMYGGVGGELLYRPFGERWSLGAEVNWVQQRDFDQRFSFRDYRIVTGHVSGHYLFGQQQRTQVSVAAGRYLAGDVGATVNVARMFENGVSMGAWATKTNVSSATFGEGGFDKGIYVSVPMDFVLPRSSRSRANMVWNPLYRDGGARVGRSYSLFQLTNERNADFFFDNIEMFDP